ncbi:MAG: DsrE family protein [Ectothiorhodospira sp.]
MIGRRKSGAGRPGAWLWGLLLVWGLAVPQWGMAADAQARVVYHADFSDPRRFSAMLTSIHNMAMHYQDQLLDADIRIVVVSHGIRFVTDDPLKETPFAADEALREARDDLKGRLGSLMDVHGVKVELCDITRKAAGLSREDLYEGVATVPSGVVRLAELQHEGFAYIKVE